jgi:hypothetical protein
MTAPKFSPRQKVRFTPRGVGQSAGSGPYEIVRLMPADTVGHQYRIKSLVDGIERMAVEAELVRSD